MPSHELPPEAIRKALERLGLDPSGVDLAWIAHVMQDTEQHIAERRGMPEFAAAAPAKSVSD